MKETLTQRRKEVAKQLEEILADKPLKSWQKPDQVYRTTAEASGGISEWSPPGDMIIRYDFKRALISSALFSLIVILFSLPNMNFRTTPPLVLKQFAGPGFIALVAFLLHFPKRGIKFVLGSEELWLDKPDMLIRWDHIAASYIKTEFSDDSKSYKLVLYHYDQYYNDFVRIETPIERLDMNGSNLLTISNVSGKGPTGLRSEKLWAQQFNECNCFACTNQNILFLPGKTNE